MFEIRKYTDKKNIDWNTFNETAKNGLFFFNRNFLEYHAERFTEHSLLIFKKNKLVALFPATENNRTILSHGGLTFGSLILTNNTKAVDVYQILEEIKNYYKNLHFNKIIYKCIPHIFSNYPAEEDLHSLFRLGAKIVRRDLSSVISLQNPIRFSETKRQLVKKCLSQNVKIVEEENLSNYWELLSQVLLKFDATPTHSLSEITYLKNQFPEKIKLFTAKNGDELIAGILIFDFGKVIHTQYMAASDEGRKMGALDFINSFLIEEYNERDYYSFGISTENEGTTLNEGLIQQKENMGARGIAQYQYEITL